MARDAAYRKAEEKIEKARRSETGELNLSRMKLLIAGAAGAVYTVAET